MKQILNKLSIFLLLFLMVATTQAQQNRKFHVQSFEQNQFDTSARVKATEKYDGNGDRYSIIKVTSTNPNDDLMAYSFDFGMMNSLVEQHDDELWVYVQRNAKHVTIKRAGYATVRNYDLRTTIQPGQVFDMVLSPEAAKISRQMLLFKVSPSSSQAIITYKREGENDYKVFGNGNVDESGMAAMSLELGTYIYKIISQKYHPTEGRVVLNTRNGKYIEQVALRPNFANVTLNTIQGADIYIDDAKKGAGSWTGTLTPGTYSLECRKESYKSSYQTITVEEGKDLTLQLDAPTPITGVLSMMSSPLDATIAVDGKDCGTTPLIIDDILVGKRKITVSKQGYTTATIDVIINEGETTEQSVTLEKLAQNQALISQTANTTNSGNSVETHEYVDLGLPSGTKWATCNVGASKPEEYGDYYAWGETETKNNYSWSTYKWCKGSENTMTKYCTHKMFGTVDYKTTLAPDDDVAHVKWGGNWRMPTFDEINELDKKCKWQWTTLNGVNGYKVTGPNGNSIFLPAAGYRYGSEVESRGSYGYYWSSSLDSDYSYGAYYLGFYSKAHDWYYHGYRYCGHTVRPVTK